MGHAEQGASLEARVASHFADSAKLKLDAAKLLSAPIARGIELMAASLKAGGKILSCGNGGSAADAQHFAAELVNRFERERAPLAGFRYGEGAGLWPQLQRGDALDLVREADNPHDANAVRVEWRGRKLGYVPRRENGAVAWGLDRGTPLRARISRLSEHANPARRIEFEVYIE